MQTNLPLGTDERPNDTSAPDLVERVRALEAELRRHRELETVLRAALDETTRSASRLLESLRAEREARERSEAENRLKDDFIATLAHDLKNPLGNVLTAVRLLVARDEIPVDLRRRLERIVGSGVRMQRMIEQLADLVEQRRGGALVLLDERHAVTELVATVVAEGRAAHPARTIALRAESVATRALDRRRLVQALRTILANAVAHGVAERPIDVSVTARAGEIRIEVHNDGPPIDDAMRATLFEPRRRSRTAASDGLGLGLYLCDAIVAAHGGRLELTSSAEHGTTVRVVLPA